MGGTCSSASVRLPSCDITNVALTATIHQWTPVFVAGPVPVGSERRAVLDGPHRRFQHLKRGSRITRKARRRLLSNRIR